MMQLVSTKKNISMVVYEDSGEIRFTTLERYNPRILDARAPRFNGTLDECVLYVHEVL